MRIPLANPRFTLRRAGFRLLAVMVPLAVAACDPAPFGGGPGVTTGGAKDIAYARQIIEDGGVPEPDTITVEGFIAEHSVEIVQPPDAGTLYATATAAWNRDFDELTPLVTLQIGFGSTVSREAFHRDALNVCLVIDRSGSMADPIDSRTNTSKLEAIQVAVDRVLAQLTSADLVSVVVFNEEPVTLLEAVPGDDFVAVKRALDGVRPEGGTDIARAMRRGFRIVEEHQTAGRSDRILVFTDALATAGTTNADDFVEMMNEFADEGIGATIFGVGTDFGQDLAYRISQVRGANLLYLNDYERILTIFDDEFDYLVTPVAYDVALTTSIPFVFTVADIYGLPEADAGSHLLQLSVPTLFFSSREGGAAIIVRLRAGALVDFTQPVEAATVTLSFSTTAGAASDETLNVTLPADLDPNALTSYFQTVGAQRGVLLLNTALTLQRACADVYQCYEFGDICYFEPYDSFGAQTAVSRLTEFLPYFDALATGLAGQASPASRTLSQERALVEKLLANIQGYVPE